MKVEMVQFLVRLLDTGLESLKNPAATKAQIVKALKAMTTSLKYGEKVKIQILIGSLINCMGVEFSFIILHYATKE